ncbi:HET-domain-containing protein [Melanomma pulvis-pyrius CBS 109.77]|uniref:HET-domain-containing protein n=1 Tax=Melanomma pulvis-pyrius CBS 109.77 TaxID=1314802 RepID=A0A6A6WR53_9PLEO|nr:HET-domain-containing protein [Melanomma pulvis-pyrius CBS 109.77]
MNTEPGSKDALELCASWLRSCKKEHSCPQPSNVWMPARVLAISRDNGSPRLSLRPTAGCSIEPYAALSYCWGGSQQVQTTTENISQHELAIDLSRLPKTLQDAVAVADSCGIKYLWVDALCITQDDAVDKAMEIANMGHVYANATVVISASRAKTAAEGFLGPRAPMGTDTPQLLFRLPFHTKGRSLGDMILIPHVPTPKEPIDERAWTLQERLLANRCLEFGPVQTRWSCSYYASRTLGTLPPVDGNSPHQVYRRLWHRIVEMQSRRLVGSEKDRLGSLAGIALRFGGLLNEDYVCGIWKHSLSSDLLWSAERGTVVAVKPIMYIAPSWSWAAINAGINMHPVPAEDLDHGFRIGGHDVVLEDRQSPFGALRSGSLQVYGCLQSVFWNPHEEKTIPSSEFAPAAVSRIRVYLDGHGIESFPGDGGLMRLSLLLVEVQTRYTPEKIVRGLALSQDGDGRYSRLGLFEHYSDPYGSDHYEDIFRWFHSEKPQKLNII